jgi:hypothetical protein
MGKNQAPSMILGCCALCLFLVALVVYDSGSAMSKEASLIDPDLHFKSLGDEGCFIVKAKLVSKSEKQKSQSSSSTDSSGSTTTTTTTYSYSCEDTYYYEVVKNNKVTGPDFSKIYEIDKRMDTSIRGNERCNSYKMVRKGPQAPKHKANITVPCWEATKDMPVERPSLYYCGNPSCIKIFSPYVKEKYEKSAGAVKLTGTLMMIFASVILIIAIVGSRYDVSNKSSEPPPFNAQNSNNNQPGQIMMIPSQPQQQQTQAYVVQQEHQQFVQPQIAQAQIVEPGLYGYPQQTQQQQFVQPQIVQPQPYVVPQQQQSVQPIQQPASKVMSVVVPPDSVSGNMILVNSPDGQAIQVQVPIGVGPGQQFQVQY